MFFTSKQPFVANGSHKAKIIKFKIKNYFEDNFSLVNNFLNQHCFCFLFLGFCGSLL